MKCDWCPGEAKGKQKKWNLCIECTKVAILLAMMMGKDIQLRYKEK